MGLSLLHRLDTTGYALLENLGVTELSVLTERQISLILSIQSRLTQTEDSRWKIHRKRAQGGHLKFEKWKQGFFASEK